MLTYRVFQRFFYIFIPQTVDLAEQHGEQHRVKSRLSHVQVVTCANQLATNQRFFSLTNLLEKWLKNSEKLLIRLVFYYKGYNSRIAKGTRCIEQSMGKGCRACGLSECARSPGCLPSWKLLESCLYEFYGGMIDSIIVHW